MWDCWQTSGTNAFISYCLFLLQRLSQYCSQAPENHRRGRRRRVEWGFWGEGCGGGCEGGRFFRHSFDSRHCFGFGLYSVLFDGTRLNLQANKRGQDIALFLLLHFPLSCHSLMGTHSAGRERPVIRAAMPPRHSATSNLLLEEAFYGLRVAWRSLYSPPHSTPPYSICWLSALL